jgi:hypothetical protein
MQMKCKVLRLPCTRQALAESLEIIKFISTLLKEKVFHIVNDHKSWWAENFIYKPITQYRSGMRPW